MLRLSGFCIAFPLSLSLYLSQFYLFCYLSVCLSIQFRLCHHSTSPYLPLSVFLHQAFPCHSIHLKSTCPVVYLCVSVCVFCSVSPSLYILILPLVLGVCVYLSTSSLHTSSSYLAPRLPVRVSVAGRCTPPPARVSKNNRAK